MKFTKGKWFKGEDDFCYIIETKNTVLAEVLKWDRKSKEWEANANLMVAAPELLDSLQTFVLLAEELGWNKATTGRQLILKRAKETIKKATSE